MASAFRTKQPFNARPPRRRHLLSPRLACWSVRIPRAILPATRLAASRLEAIPRPGDRRARFSIAAQQFSDGHWHEGFIARPPIQDGDVLRTALSVRALSVYGPPGRRTEMRDRTARAVGWLQRSTPPTTTDRSFRLLGLKWGGSDRAIVLQVAQELSATQHADGGWAQRDEMVSDAYATGLTLYALLESGSTRRHETQRFSAGSSICSPRNATTVRGSCGVGRRSSSRISGRLPLRA